MPEVIATTPLGHPITDELLLEIFQHVSDRDTHLALAQANRTFHQLIQESMLFVLSWTNIFQVNAIEILLRRHPHLNLARHPREVRIQIDLPGTALLPETDESLMDMHFEDRVHAEKFRNYFHCWRQSLQLAARFSCLAHLTLVSLPKEVAPWSYIADMTTLRTLTLRDNQLGSISQDVVSQLANLSILNHLIVDGNRGFRTNGGVSRPDEYWMSVLSGFVHLKRLTIKLDRNLSQFVEENSVRLPNLRTLELYIGANPPNLPIIIRFITFFPTLSSIRIRGRKGVDFNWPEIILPNLRSIDVHVSLFKSFIPPNTIHSVSIPEDGYQKESETASPLHPLDNIFDTFGSLPMHSIRVLHVNLREYDGAFLHCILRTIPDLREFVLNYRSGGPLEDDLVSLGGQLLWDHVPNIEVVRIFGIGGTDDILESIAARHLSERPAHHPLVAPIENAGLPATPERQYRFEPPLQLDDVRDIVLGWSWRNMLPCLREVQLAEDSVWYRKGPKFPWLNS